MCDVWFTFLRDLLGFSEAVTILLDLCEKMAWDFHLHTQLKNKALRSIASYRLSVAIFGDFGLVLTVTISSVILIGSPFLILVPQPKPHR